MTVTEKRPFGLRKLARVVLGVAVLWSCLPASGVTILKVGTLLKGDGTAMQNAVIVMEKGKLVFVGKKYPVKGHETVLDFGKSVATPGFISANAYLKVSAQTQEKMLRYRIDRDAVRIKSLSLNEERSESTPEMNLLHSIHPGSGDFEKAWRGGVTSIYVAPGNRNVFNGTGTILKTAGTSLESRVVKNDVHLKVTLGSEPAYGNSRPGRDLPGLRTRRPQNRMGVIFIFRNELMNVRDGTREPGSRPVAQDRIFRDVLKGDLPLRIRARSHLDIRAAFTLMDEFGFRWILEDGVDAAMFLDELKKRNIPVIYGPVYKTRQRPDFMTDKDTHVPRTPLLLAENGIRFAFQNNEYTPIGDLRDDVIYAVEMGLSRDQALKALTIDAAEILGVEDRLGSLEKGKDADILIFSGDPFDPRSRLEHVIVDGVLLDPYE